MAISKQEMLGTLLASIAGIIIFVSLAYYIDLNGNAATIAPILIGLGLFILFLLGPILKATTKIKFISKTLLLTFSHIFIFIGLKHYLDDYVPKYWVLFLIVGIILLNKHEDISRVFYAKK